MLLFPLVLCVIAGFCAKIVDERADRSLRLPLFAALLCAIFYGLAIGLVTTTSALSSLFLGIAVASVLANKFDHPLHLLGLLTFTLVIVFAPIASFDPWLFALFLTLGLFDELELKLLRPLAVLNTERLWVPAGAFLLFLWDAFNPAISWQTLGGGINSLLSLQGTLFLMAIICFDLAYRLAQWAGPHYLGSKPAAAIAPARRKSRRAKKR